MIGRADGGMNIMLQLATAAAGRSIRFVELVGKVRNHNERGNTSICYTTLHQQPKIPRVKSINASRWHRKDRRVGLWPYWS